MPPLKYLLTPSLALLPGLVAQTLIAADAVAQDERERWYQVELLIFSHETGAGGEQWEPLPQLAYPDASRFLVYPEQVTAREQAHDGISELDEFGRQFLRPEPEMIEEGQKEVRRFRAIISSMTPKERMLPSILNGSRKLRIAKGSGVNVAEINKMLQKFEQSKHFAKILGKSKSFK